MGDTSTTVTTGGMSAVMSAVDTITQLMGKVWDLLTSNPLLTLFVAASLLPVGIAAEKVIPAKNKKPFSERAWFNGYGASQYF